MKVECQQQRERRFSVDSRKHCWIINGKIFEFRAPKTDDYYYDYEEGQKWVDWFFYYLSHTEGTLQGEPIELLEWSEAVVRELFGWKKKKDGKRRYQTAFICVPGKNAKTQLGCGLAMGLAAIDDEPGAQVYWNASTKEQAQKTCWKMIQDMFALEVNADLCGMFEMQDSSMALSHPLSRSKVQVISSLPRGKHGFNVHAAVLDEIHETVNDEVRNVLRAKMTTRRQPLLIYITTAGNSRQHWSFKEYTRAKEIRDGIRDTEADDRYLTFISEADESCEKDLDKPEVLMKALADANPGLGKSVLMENLLLQWEECKGDPAKKDMYLQCQLNLWVERYSDFLPRSVWEACAATFNLAELKGMPCFIGVDLSESKDMTAISLLFPHWDVDDNGDDQVFYYVVPFYFLPQQALEDKPEYNAWLKHDLEIAGQDIIEYSTVRKKVKRFGKELYKCIRVLLDPAYANEFSTALEKNDKLEVEYVKQKGWALAAAIRRWKELANAGRIKHLNNPIFNHNVQNAKIVRDPETELERISKLNSVGKIDGLMASIFALHGALDYAPPKRSAYKNRGFRSV